MHPNHRSELAAMLPGELPYPYFPAREAPWLLVHRMAGPQKLANLRRGPLAGLLSRPGMSEVLSACGDGTLSPRQLLPLADPLEAFGRERQLMTDRATEAAFDAAAAADWTPFDISFTTWGSMDTRRYWRWAQISRKGENLVLQLNFPDRFVADFEYRGGKEFRKKFESPLHPVQLDRKMTLAWVRLDFDPWGEDVLIEEIQSDWMRFLPVIEAQSRQAAARVEENESAGEQFVRSLVGYNEKVVRLQSLNEIARYGLSTFGPIWARAAMLAALAFSVRELGMRRIWMHQPAAGAKLKAIDDVMQPPRSIYTDLPKRFGFQPTDRAPEFLYRARSQALANLRKSGRPLFWLLDLSDGSSVRNALQNRAA